MKKILVGIAVGIFAAVIISGMVWGVRIHQREQDPNWQIAKKLYHLESALQEIDERWKLKCLTQVIPYCYQIPDGDTVTYYCCITTYMEEASFAVSGLNRPALERVVDIEAFENRRDCEVNGLNAVMGDLDGRTYLCWTISPTYSCVIEYTAGSISEADVFRMAESVGHP